MATVLTRQNLVPNFQSNPTVSDRPALPGGAKAESPRAWNAAAVGVKAQNARQHLHLSVPGEMCILVCTQKKQQIHVNRDALYKRNTSRNYFLNASGMVG